MGKYHDILKRYWGFSDFRPLQLDIIESIGAGRDTLGLMPTGGGKSLTFQVPALAVDGVCIVVTPLIALMDDQVDHLRKQGILAATIHSGKTFHEITVALDNCIYGACKFLYVSPERLKTELFIAKVQQMNVSMIAVDEAHCISQWGYDFRPAYLNIADLRDILPNVPVIALTATATPEVVDDIMQKLKFAEPNVFQKSFRRENLAYIVEPIEDKLYAMLRYLDKMPGSAIIYVRNRQLTSEIASFLNNNNISAAFYHAGLPIERKTQTQDEWQKGTIRVIVATNAFGMGIDKPDVRLVMHYAPPDTLEAYFQEAGRAGRDGKTAWAVLFANPKDSKDLQRMLKMSYPPIDTIRAIYDSLCNSQEMGIGSGLNHVADFDLYKFAHIYRYNVLQINNSLQLLSNANIISYQPDQDLRSRLKFLITREELYSVEQRHPDLDPVIKAVLRLYTGLFTEYANIDERQIGVECKRDRQTVYEALKELARLRVVSYNPSKKCTLVTWLQERYPSKEIDLPRSVYEDRLKADQTRLESVINYYEDSSECRSRALLRYFGEKDSPACGVCDVCRRKARTPQVELEEIRSLEQGYILDYSQEAISQALRRGYISCDPDGRKFYKSE